MDVVSIFKLLSNVPLKVGQAVNWYVIKKPTSLQIDSGYPTIQYLQYVGTHSRLSRQKTNHQVYEITN